MATKQNAIVLRIKMEIMTKSLRSYVTLVADLVSLLVFLNFNLNFFFDDSPGILGHVIEALSFATFLLIAFMIRRENIPVQVTTMTLAIAICFMSIYLFLYEDQEKGSLLYLTLGTVIISAFHSRKAAIIYILFTSLFILLISLTGTMPFSQQGIHGNIPEYYQIWISKLAAYLVVNLSAYLLISSYKELLLSRSMERMELATQNIFLRQTHLSDLLTRGIVHDLNNMLTPLYGNSEYAESLLEETQPGSELQEMNKENIQIMQGMILLLSSIMRYTRSNELELTNFYINDAIENFKPIMRSIVSKKYAIEYELGSFTGLVRANESLLFQIMVNLVLNSQDAMKTSGTTISIKTYADEVKGDFDQPSTKYFCIEVDDQGCGMSDETQRKVFELDYTTKETGHGMGMTAVQSIVDFMHGFIKIDSTLGGGTRISVCLPAAAS